MDENERVAERTDQTRRPPSLSVLLASEAPIGVVLRRGPTKLVRIVIWNRANDKFKPGQWFKGRIFGERSDISPDGRHMIYFAMGGVAWAIPATRGTWTAISKLPSLKAEALWGQGDTWGGGGMFTSNKSFWLDVLWGPGRSKTFGRTAQTAMGVKIFSAGPPARPILEEVAMNKSRSETGTA